MKLVVAVIKPFKLDEVKEALNARGFFHLTVTEGKGAGNYTPSTEVYRGAEYSVAFLPCVRIEVATEDEKIDAAIEAIRSAARTDRHGDGCVYILPVEQFWKIRQNEAVSA